MENIEFYARREQSGRSHGLEVRIEVAGLLPLSPQDRDFLERDWKERGYTRSAPIGTLQEVTFDQRENTISLNYLLTEYKFYSGIAFPALPDTEEKLSQNLRKVMRASSVGCVVETADGKILVQRRKEGIIAGGMLDSAAAGMMVYDPMTGTFDWKQQTWEKLARELKIMDTSQIQALTATAIFSSRGPAHVQARKGYFTGCHSGTISSLALVNITYEALRETYSRSEVAELIGIEKSDLAQFIREHAGDEKCFVGDSCAALLAVLPEKEFYETIERLNSRETAKIRFGYLREGKFIERGF